MTHLDFHLQFVDIPPTVPLFDLVAEPVLLAGQDLLAAPHGKDGLPYRISNGAYDPDPGVYIGHFYNHPYISILKFMLWFHDALFSLSYPPTPFLLIFP